MPTALDMNQSIAALRDAYAAFNRDDMDAAVASLDENIEWIEPKEFPAAVPSVGGRARSNTSPSPALHGRKSPANPSNS